MALPLPTHCVGPDTVASVGASDPLGGSSQSLKGLEKCGVFRLRFFSLGSLHSSLILVITSQLAEAFLDLGRLQGLRQLPHFLITICPSFTACSTFPAEQSRRSLVFHWFPFKNRQCGHLLSPAPPGSLL